MTNVPQNLTLKNVNYVYMKNSFKVMRTSQLQGEIIDVLNLFRSYQFEKVYIYFFIILTRTQLAQWSCILVHVLVNFNSLSRKTLR